VVGKGRSGVRTASVMRMLEKMDRVFAQPSKSFDQTFSKVWPPAGGVVGALPAAPVLALYILIGKGRTRGFAPTKQKLFLIVNC